MRYRHQDSQYSTMPVLRFRFNRARDIGTEGSNGSFAILFLETSRRCGRISGLYPFGLRRIEIGEKGETSRSGGVAQTLLRSVSVDYLIGAVERT
jgi:hypothetical protein